MRMLISNIGLQLRSAGAHEPSLGVQSLEAELWQDRSLGLASNASFAPLWDINNPGPSF